MSLPREVSRLDEILADQALFGLSPEEELELETMLGAAGQEVEDLSLSAAAAGLELALMGPAEWREMPQGVRARLEGSGARWARATATVVIEPDAVAGVIPASASKRARKSLSEWAPWMVAAACLLLVLIVWWPTTPPPIPAVQPADALTLAWTDWDNPEVPGVRGTLVWSEELQEGVMRFESLPANDPSVSQYQLWIIDERGMNQRISGAIFDSPGADRTVEVPINPKIKVRNARAFAVTIEEPGGTWVSDMSRRVVIASR